MRLRRDLALSFMFVLPSIAAAQGTIVGTLFDSLRSNRSLAGATIVVAELGLYVQTNDRGRFEIVAVPSGRYTLAFFDSPLDSLGIESPRVTVDVPASGEIFVHLATPAPLSLLRSLCGRGVDSTSGAVVGSVRAAEDGSPVSGEMVTSRWSQYAISKDKGLRAQALVSTARSNAAGGYVLCSLPRDIPVDLTLGATSNTHGTASVEIGQRHVVRRDFALARSATTAVGAIRGTVRTVNGRVASNAIVEIGGLGLTMRSDTVGRFAFLGVPVGTWLVEGKSLGSEPVEATVDVPLGGWATLDLVFGRDVQALPAATILGRANAVDLTGFDTRRRSGIGEFMTAADIERYRFVRVSEAMYRFSGLFVGYSMKSGDGAPKLAFKQRSLTGGDCTPRYYVDGFLESDAIDNPLTEIDLRLQPSGLRGIEMHTAWNAPIQFPPDPQTGCGVVLIWTKSP
ncbi:MAG: hypothetical protein HY059_07455 [Proteobacteria bacterium]|nr:hypothetical protein [Pseudomonadota bacterium]